MKKIISILLAAALLCAMLAVFTLPASAKAGKAWTTEMDTSQNAIWFVRRDATAVADPTEEDYTAIGNGKDAVGVLQSVLDSTAIHKEFGYYVINIIDGYFDAQQTLTIPECVEVMIRSSGEQGSLNWGALDYKGNAFTMEEGSTLRFDGKTTVDCFGWWDIEGGAIRVNGDNCTVEGGIFVGCQAERGGGIWVDGNNCSILDCTFRNCVAAEYGGAVCVTDNDPLALISNCTFKNCRSDDDGGAVFLDSDDNTVNNCVFIGCSCDDEGNDVYDNETASLISNCKTTNDQNNSIVDVLYNDNCAYNIPETTAVSKTGFDDLSAWQGGLDQSLPITAVNMPGTHDSATFGDAPIAGFGFVRDQSHSFIQQFSIGSRYVDGRFTYDKENEKDLDNIFLCHGNYRPTMNGDCISLRILLNEMNAFLDEHPSEYFILPFTDEDEDDMEKDALFALLEETFRDLAAKNPDRYLYVENSAWDMTDPNRPKYLGNAKAHTVAEAKGHILFTPDNRYGITIGANCVANDWDSGTAGKLPEITNAFNIHILHPIAEYSAYYSTSSDGNGSGYRSPRIVHTSGYHAVAPMQTPAEMVQTIRPWICGRVDAAEGYAAPSFKNGYYYGIVLFDFIHADECRKIVDTNAPLIPEPEGDTTRNGIWFVREDAVSVEYDQPFSDVASLNKYLSTHSGNTQKKGRFVINLRSPGWAPGGTLTIPENVAVEIRTPDASANWDLDYKNRAFVMKNGSSLTFADNIHIIECGNYDIKGGAIYAEGDGCTVRGGVFENNHAEYGGAIYADGDNCKVSHCTFIKNIAEEDGGAVYLWEPVSTVECCGFYQNRADDDGGAVYADDDAVIAKCNFFDNTADDDGGSVSENNEVGDVKINDCFFSGGDADYGIWVYGNGDAILTNCTAGDGDHYYRVEENNRPNNHTSPFADLGYDFGYNSYGRGETGLSVTAYRNGTKDTNTSIRIRTVKQLEQYIEHIGKNGSYDKIDIDLCGGKFAPLTTIDIPSDVTLYVRNGTLDGTKCKTLFSVRGDNVTLDLSGMTMVNSEPVAVYGQNCTINTNANGLASVFSDGNLWIVIGIAAVVVIGVVVLILIKKKKTPVTAGGTETDE